MSEEIKSAKPVFHSENPLESLYRLLVIRTVLSWQAWRCRRARAYLLAHDDEYRSKHISHEIVKRRNVLYDQGVSPNDPAIPDHWSISEELRPMAWPRSSERG